MLDVCLLGTGGMMPLPRRHLTSLMMRFNGSNILIDCGEATQVAIKKQGWSFKDIDIICFTHYHGDHIGGLPGLLLTMANSNRTAPLTLIGPKGLDKVVRCLCIIAHPLPFEFNFIELSGKEESFEFEGFSIDAFKVVHRITCYGYSLNIPRAGKFDAQRAKELDIPLNFWNRLQHGESVSCGERLFTPDMVLGPEREGLKVTYCTDTRPCELIPKHAKGSDLLVLEGMYGDPQKQEDAIEKFHMTFYEAAKIGRLAQPKRMWLTHYSPSLVRPKEYIDAAKEIFERVECGKDLKSITLKFED